jgi:hypothetical protein
MGNTSKKIPEFCVPGIASNPLKVVRQPEGFHDRIV